MKLEILKRELESSRNVNSEITIHLENKIAELLSRIVPNGENLALQEFQFGIKGISRRKDVLVILWLYHSLEKSLLKFYIGWWLEGYSEKYHSMDVKLYIHSKEYFLLYLSRHQSERDFYGNFLPKIKSYITRISISRKIPTKPRRNIRHRGYRDKGTLRPNHKWFEKSDWSFDQFQNLIEEKREFTELCLSRNKQILENKDIWENSLAP